MNSVVWGKRQIGEGKPIYLIAEIGINHNGSLQIAKELIDLSKNAGFDAVKFQKRTPEICVPQKYRNVMRKTPWGIMSYMDYRKKIEFGKREYQMIDRYCKKKKIDWFASCWDIPSVDFMEQFNLVGYKVASACLTDDKLLKHITLKKRPVILSTGMSTMKQIKHAVPLLDKSKLLLAHSTSIYACDAKELNLRMISTLKETFRLPAGYSGHEAGLPTTYAAVALGACFIERHVTLNRALWGSDQTSSIDPADASRLVRDVRLIEQAMGDGIKRVYKSEYALMKKLRVDGLDNRL